LDRFSLLLGKKAPDRPRREDFWEYESNSRRRALEAEEFKKLNYNKLKEFEALADEEDALIISGIRNSLNG
jgi:hypothetical protein